MLSLTASDVVVSPFVDTGSPSVIIDSWSHDHEITTRTTAYNTSERQYGHWTKHALT